MITHPLRRAVLAALAAVLVAALAAPARAGKGDRYYFDLGSLELEAEAPDDVLQLVRQALAAEFEKHDAILVELPKGAPDPKKSPQQFKDYLRKRDIRAYTLRLEVTNYERAVEEAPDARSSRRLKVGISLRLFGETMPDRSLGFAGAGSATIALEVGAKIREREEEVAHRDAIEVAVADAVRESLQELGKPPPTQRKNKKKRGKKKRKS